MTVSYIASASAEAASLSMPSHQAGDLLIFLAYNWTNTITPALPSGWLNVANVAGSTNAIRVGFKLATSAAETSGAWTNATAVACACYRDSVNLLGVGGSAVTNGASLTINYEAVVKKSFGNAWYVATVGYRTNDTTLEDPPTGMTNRLNFAASVGEVAIHDTNGDVASWARTLKTNTGTSSGYSMVSLEIVDLGISKSSGGSAVIVIED